jgi:hypothetical protein
MSSTRSRLGIVVVLVLCVEGAVGACAAAPSEDAHRWWSHIQVLANDSLRGRRTGTPDYLTAARYVAAQFRMQGVKPGGPVTRSTTSDEAYFQSVPFIWRKIRESECSLALVRGGVPTPLELGRDANLSTSIEAAESVEAPMVFVGYGLSVPEAGYDELKGLDLRGKVAVYVRSGPDTLPGPLRAHAQASDVRWAGLRAAGAIGAASVTPPKLRETPWSVTTLQRLQPSLTLDDDALNETPGMRLTFRINTDHFGPFLEGSGHSPEEILTLADSGRSLPTFPLPASIRARVRYDRKKVESPNVVGIIPGSDPKLRDQYVVVSAHLDHLGVGAPVDGDSIYNGAMDNASGVASLIEFARYARAAGSPFRRSVMLLAVTGEEEGLKGSKWFAAHPTVPSQAIVADVNLDMFLPIVPLTVITVHGLHESDLGDRFAAVAKQAGIPIQDDPEPWRNHFIRSDQYSFIRRGVPSLFFAFGAEKGSPDAQRLKEWTRKRYHEPADDLSQPVNLDDAVRFTRLLFDFTRDVANAEAAPRWKPDSFFRRFAAPNRAAAAQNSDTQAPAPTGLH